MGQQSGYPFTIEPIGFRWGWPTIDIGELQSAVTELAT